MPRIWSRTKPATTAAESTWRTPGWGEASIPPAWLLLHPPSPAHTAQKLSSSLWDHSECHLPLPRASPGIRKDGSLVSFLHKVTKQKGFTVFLGILLSHCLLLYRWATGCVFSYNNSGDCTETKGEWPSYINLGSLHVLIKDSLNITEQPFARTPLSKSEILPSPTFLSDSCILILLPGCREQTFPVMFISLSPNINEAFSVGDRRFPQQTLSDNTCSCSTKSIKQLANVIPCVLFFPRSINSH